MTASDCAHQNGAAAVCNNLTCIGPADGIQNLEETDIDCGGVADGMGGAATIVIVVNVAVNAIAAAVIAFTVVVVDAVVVSVEGVVAVVAPVVVVVVIR